MTNPNSRYELCIIGGAGHVGLPLAVSFANAGIQTVITDINADAVQKIRAGTFPFKEENGEQELRKALASGRLEATDAPDVISQSDAVLLVIGTPIDEYLNPNTAAFWRAIESTAPHVRDGQLLILRSTVFPGTTENVARFFVDRGVRVNIAFCPERIAQGHALKELAEIPQIVSATDEETLARVSALFERITKKIIRVKPIEAELAKLFSNAWRYIRFAVANQFYMIAEEKGVDYHAVHRAMCEDYPRNAGLPSPGFAAGPCLFKDTMQIASFAHNTFFLGHAAMLVNEGLPDFLIQQLKRSCDLKTKTIGILGMAFKANNDDKRDSLSYKLKKLAEIESKRVLCHDIYIKDSAFRPLEDVLRESDVVIIATPHDEYAKIERSRYPHIRFVDIWNALPG